MKCAKVIIVGISPLLMNRWNTNVDPKSKRKNEQHTPEGDAEKAVHRDAEIGCFAPSSWIEACIRDASKEFKRGKSSFKSTVLSSVFVDPDKIPFDKNFDEIDIRPVVIQRNRIPRARPKFNTWKLKFNIFYDENRIEKETLKEILEEAGVTKGIGDYRPKFGRFKIEKFE